MKTSTSITLFVIMIMLFSTTIGPARAQGLEPQAGVGQGFTYQGRLAKNGNPVSGSCDFTFTLWNAASGGTTPLGSEAKTGVNVSGGVFTVLLNESGQFGASAFDGSQRWLGISVKCTGDSTATDLGRQSLSAAPYASYALTAGSLSGVLPVAKGGTGSATQNFVDLTNAQLIGGTKTFTSAPGFSVASGVPFTVSSTTKVVNLNADLLDGFNSGNSSGQIPVSNGTVNTNLNADLLDGQQASAFQGRVSGNCAVGSTIRVVNADGSVVCQPDAPLNRAAVPQANAINTLDSAGDMGWYTSVTIGADGLPVISYLDNTNGDLKVLHCGNAACSSGNALTPVDSTGNVGGYTSVTIGADGLPVISYYDFTNGDLKVAHCGNAVCNSSGNVLTTVDSTGDVGEYTSIAIGADGLPVISYYDKTNGDLKVAHCGNAVCNSSGNTSTTMDSTGDVGYYTSITIGTDGLPVMSYYDLTNSDLKVLHCGNAACSSNNTITPVDSTGDVGKYTFITIGADGLPVVSYFGVTNANLKVAHCGNVACSSGHLITLLDSAGIVGTDTSITIGADGLPVISYLDFTNNNLKVAHCGDAACSSGNTSTTVDSAGDVGWFTSITIGVDGLPVISYYDNTNSDLKVVHCSNAFCTPYWRRR
jgi:hypothetical protein